MPRAALPGDNLFFKGLFLSRVAISLGLLTALALSADPEGVSEFELWRWDG